MISELFWKIYFARSGATKYWNELDTFSRLTPTERKWIIADRLYNQVQYFGHRADAIPEWKAAAGAKSPEELWELWPTLPILTKNELQSSYRPETIRDTFNIEGAISQTGGSTGEPTRFIWDAESMRARGAAQFYCWLKFGWRPGVPTMCLWGSARDLGLGDKRKRRIMRRLKNTELVDGFAFDETTVERARTFLDSHDEVCIYGYSSLLEQLADAYRDRGIPVPNGKVQAVWNGAEAVTPEQSEAFRAVFGREIQNQYGGREFGAMAFQPTGSDGLELLRPNLFVEVVDDAGQPCAPGEVGRLIITTLIGKGTPFLRYENGDLGTYASNGADESGIFKLSSLEGRLSGMVRLNGGRVVHNTFWGMLIKEFAGVDQFQVRQAADRSISILLKGDGLSPESEQRLRMLLENTVKETPLTLSWVDKIPLSREGKLIQVHSDVDAAS